MTINQLWGSTDDLQLSRDQSNVIYDEFSNDQHKESSNVYGRIRPTVDEHMETINQLQNTSHYNGQVSREGGNDIHDENSHDQDLAVSNVDDRFQPNEVSGEVSNNIYGAQQ